MSYRLRVIFWFGWALRGLAKYAKPYELSVAISKNPAATAWWHCVPLSNVST